MGFFHLSWPFEAVCNRPLYSPSWNMGCFSTLKPVVPDLAKLPLLNHAVCRIMLKFWLFVCLLLFSSIEAKAPSALYLSWKKDPTTTMVIQWHTSAEHPDSIIYLNKEGEAEWKSCEGRSSLLKSSILVHTIELEELKENSVYFFRVGKEQEIYKFRTCAQNLETRPLRFIVAGDAYYYHYLFQTMNQQMAKIDPDFIVIGGDIAYVYNSKKFFKGKNWEERRWGAFFEEWKKQMVTSDGRLIPLVAVVGNHDVSPKQQENSFYAVFAFPEKNTAYRVLDFGSYLSLFLLDTNHTHPIEGPQTTWLEKELLLRSHISYKIPVYHVAAYPSIYPYDGSIPTKIRKEWIPFFEQYGVKFAFENHNHAYKRTYPIKEGRIDPQGIVYLGDGTWGVAPRIPEKRWYTARSAAMNCFWLVSLSSTGAQFQSFGLNGALIEEIAQP